MDAFVVEHIFLKLPMDPSMVIDVVFFSIKVNWGWHKVVGLKHYEISQCLLPMHNCSPRISKAVSQTCLHFEINCLKTCLLNDKNK